MRGDPELPFVKPSVAFFALTCIALVAGCESNGTNQPNRLPTYVEGQFETVEEGFLSLRLDNGQVELFNFPPGSDSMNSWIPAAIWDKAPYLQGGPRCRVFHKPGTYEDIEGTVIDTREITRLEWLSASY